MLRHVSQLLERHFKEDQRRDKNILEKVIVLGGTGKWSMIRQKKNGRGVCGMILNKGLCFDGG